MCKTKGELSTIILSMVIARFQKVVSFLLFARFVQTFTCVFQQYNFI